MSVDLVSIVEAAYRLHLDDDGWLRGIVRAARPALGTGEGALGFLVDANSGRDGLVQILAAAGEGLDERDFELFHRLNQFPSTAGLRDRFLRAGPAGTVGRTLREAFAQPGGFGAVMRSAGVLDSVYVLCGDTLGLSCVLASPCRSPLSVSPERWTALAQLAAHVAAAYRLRRHSPGAWDHADASVEAILDPTGNVQHALGQAKAPRCRLALRTAAAAADRARGRMRWTEPESAVAMWAALVAGRWSLVETFDTDGRRFMVARRDEPDVIARASLSVRECQVAALVAIGHANKVVAYELGVSVSTVGTHLASAMHKLGVRTRNDLLQLFSQTMPKVSDAAEA